MNRRFFSLVLFFNVIIFGAIAQTNIIDEVVWIVGDEAIFRSEVEKQRIRARDEGTPIEGDPYCVIPEQIAIQKLFLHQAAIDSIEVGESQVMASVEAQLNFYISQIGSKEKLEEYFGKNLVEIREEFRDVVRDQMIIKNVQESLVKDISATPADVRRFYNNLPEGEIPTVAAQVELQIISSEPPVSLDEINRIKDRLREFTDRVNSGDAEFSMLARLYSEDLGSAKKGGELGFMGRGQLVPEFATAAFNLQDPNKVSRIVESEFGFHIIQLIEKRGDRVNSRHILMKPRISMDDRNKAAQRMDSVATLIRTGKITFEQGVTMYSQDKNTAMNAGLMFNPQTESSKFEYQELPAEVAKVAYNMSIGEISKPFTMINASNNKEAVAIVKIKSKTDTHKANLNDDYQMLKNYYEAKKKEEFLNEWIAKKQKETYINIDPAWVNCEFKYPGWIK